MYDIHERRRNRPFKARTLKGGERVITLPRNIRHEYYLIAVDAFTGVITLTPVVFGSDQR